MRSIMTFLALAGVLAVLSGCETTTTDVAPGSEPFIRGTITAIDGNTIRVEVNPAEEHRGKKALLRITKETIILDSLGEPLSQSDLVIGQIVSVWVTGPVIETYPVQAKASLIVVEPEVVPL